MASDMFIKIGKIDGESTDHAHKKWIEILSFNHGVSQMASAGDSSKGGGSSQRADFQVFSIVKMLDSATPLLNLACASGTVHDEIIVQLCKATSDKTVYMEYTMSDAIISSVSVGGGGGGEATESVTINYGKFKWNYTPVDAKGKTSGNVPAGWNLQENKAI